MSPATRSRGALSDRARGQVKAADVTDTLRGLPGADERAHELVGHLGRDGVDVESPRPPEGPVPPRRGRRGSARGRSPRNPAAASLSRYSRSSSAPATQPIQSSTLRRISAGTSPRTTTSDTARRPPGFSTRNASDKTRSLSAERLITQLEMMTSTEFDGQGDLLDLSLEELHVGRAGLPLILAGEGEHLVGHVEAVRLARRSHAAGGQEHVDAASRSEIENGLARLELRQRGRIPAAERGGSGLGRQRGRVTVRVDTGGDRIALTTGRGRAAAGATARPRSLGARPARTSPSRCP